MEGMEVNTSFWSGKRVLITGHTGFKGGWLSLWLQEMGVELSGFALHPPSNPSFYEVADVGKGMNSIIGDIRDQDKLTLVIKKNNPEIVFHMAAQPLVRRSYIDPIETYSTNIMGTINLLEAIRKTTSVRALINVTTDKCYDNKEWLWGYRETDPIGGYDPYSSSKACVELVTSAYKSSYFQIENSEERKVGIATARAGNVIGGGDWSNDRIIPDIIKGLVSKEKIIIRNPASIRPWQHVLEPLSGYLILAEKLYHDPNSFSKAYNFGPDEKDVKTVQWLVDYLIDKWDIGVGWDFDGKKNPHEAHYLKLDCSRARFELNWVPKWDLMRSLDTIITWHKDYLKIKNNTNMRSSSIDQINNYIKSLVPG